MTTETPSEGTVRVRTATTDPACDRIELSPGDRARLWVAPTAAGAPPDGLLAVASGRAGAAWWVLGIDASVRWVLRSGDATTTGWTDRVLPVPTDLFAWTPVEIAIDDDATPVVAVAGAAARLPGPAAPGPVDGWQVTIGAHQDHGWTGPTVDGRPWYDGFVGFCGPLGLATQPPKPELDPRSAWPPPPVQDLDRPRWHFAPPTGWMNEPHGALHHDGRHHLFYQRNELGAFWGAITWGHAVSDDLVTWHDVGHALEPRLVPSAPAGIWSGSSATDADGVPHLFFTAGDERDEPNQRTVVARPAGGELRWAADGPPVTTWHQAAEAAAVQGLDLLPREFRDPFVWREGEEWFQLVGTGVEGRGGTAVLFEARGPDGPWRAVGPLLVGDIARHPETGVMWELPGLVPIGRGSDGRERHLFLVSPWWDGPGPHWLQYVWCWIGVWDGSSRTFRPDHAEPVSLDVGGYLTGGTVSVTEDGRVLLWSITQDLLSETEHRDRGWAGSAGVPLELGLRDDRLTVAPVREVAGLRDGAVRLDGPVGVGGPVGPGGPGVFELSSGPMWELALDIDLPTGGSVVLAVRPGGSRTTTLTVSRDAEGMVELRVDGPAERREGPGRRALADLPGLVPVRVLADHSVVEAFVGDRVVATTRAWAGPGVREGVVVEPSGGARLVEHRAWRLRAVPVRGDRRWTTTTDGEAPE